MSLQAVTSRGLQVQPNHLLLRHDSLSTVHPLDDAFTMSVKAVLRHACRHSHHLCRQRTGSSLSLGRRGAVRDAPLQSETKRLPIGSG